MGKRIAFHELESKSVVDSFRIKMDGLVIRSIQILVLSFSPPNTPWITWVPTIGSDTLATPKCGMTMFIRSFYHDSSLSLEADELLRIINFLSLLEFPSQYHLISHNLSYIWKCKSKCGAPFISTCPDNSCGSFFIAKTLNNKDLLSLVSPRVALKSGLIIPLIFISISFSAIF